MVDDTKDFDRTSQIKTGSDSLSNSRKWHLLVIGEKGKVLSIRKLKGLFMVLLFTLMLSLAVSGYIGYLYTKNKMEKGLLLDSIAQLEDKQVRLKDEKEILLARLVIAESKLKAMMEKKDVSFDEVEKTSETSVDRPTPLPLPDEKKKVSPQPLASEKKPLPEKSSEPVRVSMTVQGFKAGRVFQKNQVWAKFVVRNTTPGRIPVLGRCVVLLRTVDENPEKWVTLPKVPLVDGKPSGRRGSYFKIANFKPFRFKTERIKLPVTFVSATVYVFSAQGKTLYEEDHAIDLSFDIQAEKDSEPIAPLSDEGTEESLENTLQDTQESNNSIPQASEPEMPSDAPTPATPPEPPLSP